MKSLIMFLGGLIIDITQLFSRPRSICLEASGRSMDECLRRLEKKAGLPRGDLYVEGEPAGESYIASGFRSISHNVCSKTSDEWQNTNPNEGYISVSVIETNQNILKENNLRFLGSLCLNKGNSERECQSHI